MSSEFLAGQSQKPRVLIVDDDLLSREMLRFALSDDFELEQAETGEQALAAANKNPPQLVVMDIEIPGMNGYETCRRMRKNTTCPIIFVSSHDTLEERIEAFESGGNDFIIKPFDAEILARKVSLAIQGNGTEIQ